jgi:hypothetical protein
MMENPRRERRGFSVLFLLTILPTILPTILVGCAPEERSGDAAPDLPAATLEAPVAVVRELLAVTADPPGAPGMVLTLARYTIAPGAILPPHLHPGLQLARIEAGTLRYHVVEGEVTLQRSVNAEGVAAREERLTGPDETRLYPGDVVLEIGEMLHFGANDTDAPLVILATLLTPVGEPLARTVEGVDPVASPEG